MHNNIIIIWILLGRRICNRWLVAYTLVRNPSLIPLTATNLEATNMVKKLYEVDNDDNIMKLDADNDEKVALESVKVDVNVEQEKDTGTNM